MGEEATAKAEKNEVNPPVDLDRVKDTLPSYDLSDLTIFIDPLDGTHDFVKGNLECVAILIGITVKGRPTAGVIHLPFIQDEKSKKDRVIWGAVGLGAFGLENREFPKDGKTVLIVSNSYKKYHTEPFIEAVEV